MARYELHLTARPRRWTTGLEVIAAGADAELRARIDAYIASADDGSLLLVASDDLARVTEHWEQCNRERLAVCIFDRSTAWDLLRDRLRPRAAPAAASPTSGGGADGSPAETARVERPVAASRLSLSMRTRVTLMAACAFVALVGVAALVSPHTEQNAAPTPSPTNELAPRGEAPSATPGASGANAADARRDPSREDARPSAARPSSQGGCVARDGESATTPGALAFAFVIGWALAWGAGLLVERRGAGIATEHLRVARQVATLLGVLVAALSVLLRVSALSAAREVMPRPEVSPELAEVDDASAPDEAESVGPFTRFLRQHRGARGAGRFRGFLADWRAEHEDGGVADASLAFDVTLPREHADDPAPGSLVDAAVDAHDRHHRHERHAGHHHGHADAGAVAHVDAHVDASADATPAAHSDGGARVTTDASRGASPSTRPEPGPHGDASVARGPAARSSRRAQSRPPRTSRRPDPPPPRSPWSPVSAFAAGIVAGLVLSPRWRALARGDR